MGLLREGEECVLGCMCMFFSIPYTNGPRLMTQTENRGNNCFHSTPLAVSGPCVTAVTTVCCQALPVGCHTWARA